MDGLALDRDAAEMRAAIFAHGFVVIAGNEDQLGPLADLAQELLQHVVVGLRPVDAAPNAPEIDDVADQINAWGVVAAQKFEKGLGLTCLGPKMDVRNKERPVTPWLGVHLRLIIGRSIQQDKARIKLILYQCCDIHDAVVNG